MIKHDNVLVMDVDGTLCPIKSPDVLYDDLVPDAELINKLRELVTTGWWIILHSARGMRTHGGNTGKINANVLPDLIKWLKKHDIPFHEIYMGKPWAGSNGFYVDDRAIRPREFMTLTFEELHELCKKDRII